MASAACGASVPWTPASSSAVCCCGSSGVANAVPAMPDDWADAVGDYRREAMMLIGLSAEEYDASIEPISRELRVPAPSPNARPSW